MEIAFICRKCGKEYGRDQDHIFGGPKDPDWNPWNGHCYDCELDFCYQLYGGWMEPTFIVNSRIDGTGELVDGSEDIPF